MTLRRHLDTKPKQPADLGENSGNGFVLVKRGNITYVSCYFRPPAAGKPDYFEENLEELEDALQQGTVNTKEASFSEET